MNESIPTQQCGILSQINNVNKNNINSVRGSNAATSANNKIHNIHQLNFADDNMEIETASLDNNLTGNNRKRPTSNNSTPNRNKKCPDFIESHAKILTQNMINKSNEIRNSLKSTQDTSKQYNNQTSNQSQITGPPIMTEYPQLIHPPYKVIIQPQNTNSADSKPKTLHPIEVAKIIIPLFPKNAIEEIKKSGKNKISLITYNRNAANRILNLQALKEKNLVAFIPNSYVYKQCIIRNVPVDLTEVEIIDNLELVSPVGDLKPVKVRRFYKRQTIDSNADKNNSDKSLTPTKTIQITYLGQVMPQHAYLMRVKYEVDHYYPKIKFCTNCYRYGHVKSICKSKSRCIKCGDSSHSADACTFIEIKCLNCQGDHLPTHQECRTRMIEQKIRDMAVKNNQSIQEAKVLYNAHSTQRKKFRFSDFPTLGDVSETENTGNHLNFQTQTFSPKNYRQRLFTNSSKKSPNKLNTDDSFTSPSKEFHQTKPRKIQTIHSTPHQTSSAPSLNTETESNNNYKDHTYSYFTALTQKLNSCSIDEIQKEADEIINFLKTIVPPNYIIQSLDQPSSYQHSTSNPKTLNNSNCNDDDTMLI